MNAIVGRVVKIQQSGSITLVDVDVKGLALSALMINLPPGSAWIHEGGPIGVLFKETEVSLGKNVQGMISLRNQLPCTVRSVARGELLTIVTLDFFGLALTSAITTRSADMLALRPGDAVTAFIKANEITLTERAW